MAVGRITRHSHTFCLELHNGMGECEIYDSIDIIDGAGQVQYTLRIDICTGKVKIDTYTDREPPLINETCVTAPYKYERAPNKED